MILARYTLTVRGPDDTDTGVVKPEREAWWNNLLKETEENMTDLLPDGFSVTIEEKEETDE